MYVCARGIDFVCFCDFSIRFRNCSDGAVFCVFHFDVLLNYKQ
jgi:hypothetical protein